MIIVDASIVYKWIVDEEPLAVTTQARTLLRNLAQDGEEIIAPNILMYEIGNVFAYKAHLEIDDIKKAWQEFSLLPILFEDTNLEFIGSCIEFSKKHIVSVYDAAYAVLAKEKRCDLITADAKFVRQVNLPYVKLLK